MDMFLPSVPVIARDFGTEPGTAQLAVTTYLLGLAIGQLAWGPISDRYGRKPVLLAGASHWSALVLPMIGYLFGCAFMIPNATAAALSPFPQMAGSASSLLGAIPFGLGALLSALLAAAFDGTTLPMAVAIAVFGLLAFIFEKYFFRKTSHG